LSTLVIDSWALIEWTLDQPSADPVEEILKKAAAGTDQLVMSWINVGECVYMIARKRSQPAAENFLKRLPSLPIRLVLPTADCFVRAARIKSKFKLSYADAFAVDLAVQEQASIVTGDPEIAALSLAKVVWVGRSE
jgi:predicted nucleic acid-binding protein